MTDLPAPPALPGDAPTAVAQALAAETAERVLRREDA